MRPIPNAYKEPMVRPQRRSRARFLLALPGLVLPWPATAARQDGRILERSAYTFPSWDAAIQSTDAERYATADEYAAAAGDERFVLEKLRYRSDELAVVAYLYRPADAALPARPVIVFNRGSYVRNDIAPELLPMFHRLAVAGFTIIAPMYRGSNGGEGRDDLGGDDLNDLMNIADVLRELDGVDRRNVFLYGESRGGMMVFQAVRDGFPARAAATFGAFTDLADLTSAPRGAATAASIWPDFDERREQIIERRSAMRWPERLTLPLLLMHGSADDSVPPAHALRLAVRLAETAGEGGPEYGVIVFPGGNHILSRQRIERDRHAVEFFRRHMID